MAREAAAGNRGKKLDPRAKEKQPYAFGMADGTEAMICCGRVMTNG